MSVTAVCVLLGAVMGSGVSVAQAARRALPVRVRVGGVGRGIPRSFLGLSMEVNELSSYARAGAVFDRTVSLLRSERGDPMVLRVGGKSADGDYWETATLGAPWWVFEIGDGWLGQLAALARRDRLRVTLG